MITVNLRKCIICLSKIFYLIYGRECALIVEDEASTEFHQHATRTVMQVFVLEGTLIEEISEYIYFLA